MSVSLYFEFPLATHHIINPCKEKKLNVLNKNLVITWKLGKHIQNSIQFHTTVVFTNLLVIPSLILCTLIFTHPMTPTRQKILVVMSPLTLLERELFLYYSLVHFSRRDPDPFQGCPLETSWVFSWGCLVFHRCTRTQWGFHERTMMCFCSELPWKREIGLNIIDKSRWWKSIFN